MSVLVLFGATGDLARRKLVPALQQPLPLYFDRRRRGGSAA